MLKKVKETIREYGMLNPGDTVLVGVSGGADSVCLLSVLRELKEEYALNLFVSHVHHGLRKEADNEAEFVSDFCKDLGILCDVAHFDASAYAKEKGRSIEEASRDFRYAHFSAKMREYHCTKLALAHQKNDLAETVLFRMVRGTGPRGMQAIPAVRDLEGGGVLIRPLYDLTRAEIESYLEKKKIPFVTDNSNFEVEYARNRIRNLVLPELVTVNDRAISHITDFAAGAYRYWQFADRQADLLMKEIVRPLNEDPEFAEIFPVEPHGKADKTKLSENIPTGKGISIDLAGLKAADPLLQAHLLYRLLIETSGFARDWEQKHVHDVLSLLEKETGKMIDLPYKTVAVKRRKALWLTDAETYRIHSCQSRESKVE